MHVNVIASASGQWLKLVALGQMSSVAHRPAEQGLHRGTVPPIECEMFNIDAMGVAWKE